METRCSRYVGKSRFVHFSISILNLNLRLYKTDRTKLDEAIVGDFQHVNRDKNMVIVTLNHKKQGGLRGLGVGVELYLWRLHLLSECLWDIYKISHLSHAIKIVKI